MAQVHASIYRQMTDVELVGAVNPDDEGYTTKMLGLPCFSSLDDIPRDRFDILDICVPTYLHKFYVLAGADLGKSMICEKPLALSLGEAKEIIEFVQARQVQFMVGHVVRFFPEYVRAKELIQSGELGDIGVVRTFRGGSFPHGWRNWYANHDLSGGTFIDLMIHDFDYLRWVLGPIDRIFAKTTRKENGRQLEYSVAVVRFLNGTIAHMQASWAHNRFGTRFEFAGSRGLLQHDSLRRTALNIELQPPETEAGGVQVPSSSIGRSPYQRELDAFINAIRYDRPLPITLEEAYEALRIAHAARRSADMGQPVVLREEPEA